MSSPRIFDCVVVGGGVIGLSIAYRLSEEGMTVALLERRELGREASWAGAGILSPVYWDGASHPFDQLAALSFELHPQWAQRLKSETGIDTGFRRCGALYIARTPGDVAALTGQTHEWTANGVEHRALSETERRTFCPALASNDKLLSCVSVSSESQIRNPRHLSALVSACQRRGVVIVDRAGEIQLRRVRERILSLKCSAGDYHGDRFCFSAGAWTGGLLNQIGVSISTLPVRGQMVLFKLPERPVDQIIWEGGRYIVARDDGHVLAGSTVEEVGFNRQTTTEAIDSLTEFACGLVGPLHRSSVVNQWAGLRPATFDGFPYIGQLPGCQNAWAACGHFRTGLTLSTGTAEVIALAMLKKPLPLDINPFRLHRG